MKTYRLALIGFGNVGQGFVQILKDYGTSLAEESGAAFRVVAICDAQKGSIYQPEGYEPQQLLDAVQRDGNLFSLPARVRNMDALQTITESNADIVAEMSFTDLKTGQPAISYVETAIKNKKHVVTTNKGPAALAYQGLKELAALYGVEFGVEGTVMSGTPALRLGSEALQGRHSKNSGHSQRHHEFYAHPYGRRGNLRSRAPGSPGPGLCGSRSHRRRGRL